MNSGTIDELDRDYAGDGEFGGVESNIMVLRVAAAREAVMADLDRDALVAYTQCRVVAHLINAAYSISTKGIEAPVPVHCTNIALEA